MIRLGKFNIFTALMFVTVFVLAMRIVDISNFSIQESIAESADTKEVPVRKMSPREKAIQAENKSVNKSLNTAIRKQSKFKMDIYSSEELEVLRSLSKRRESLELREREIVKQEALLKAAEGEVERKVTELVKIKSELKKLLEDQSKIQKERVQSLVKIYSGMKPKQASRIFDTLNMDILLAVIGKMSERKTSPILANMNPEKARKITIKLAEQHKLPVLIKKKEK